VNERRCRVDRQDRNGEVGQTRSRPRWRSVTCRTRVMSNGLAGSTEHPAVPVAFMIKTCSLERQRSRINGRTTTARNVRNVRHPSVRARAPISVAGPQGHRQSVQRTSSPLVHSQAIEDTFSALSARTHSVTRIRRVASGCPVFSIFPPKSVCFARPKSDFCFARPTGWAGTAVRTLTLNRLRW
jgi:hypothetical protein